MIEYLTFHFEINVEKNNVYFSYIFDFSIDGGRNSCYILLVNKRNKPMTKILNTICLLPADFVAMGLYFIGTVI